MSKLIESGLKKFDVDEKRERVTGGVATFLHETWFAVHFLAE
jgi:hypothetical protein